MGNSMEETLYAAVTIVLLAVWYVLEKKAMTPYDIYRKWKVDINYVAPEEVGILIAKTKRAISAVEDIFDSHGPNTEGGAEAVEVLQRLRKFHRELLLRR